MTKEEFQKICIDTWGKYWKRPAGRALNRDEGMMRRYASGQTEIPDEVATRLKEIIDIGRAGEIVKSLIIDKYPPAVAHDIASEAANQMARAGIIRGKKKD